MNDRKITELLRKRDKMLTRRDGLYDHAVIDEIDAQLAAVEPGTRNDVDLALGRMCATLPDRPVYDAAWFDDMLRDRYGDMTGATWPLQAICNTANASRANIARANVDDQYFYDLCYSDDSAHGMMGDRD